MKHRWANRVLPALVVTIVAACVWYALANRPQPTVVARVAAAQSLASNPTPAQPTPTLSPTVKKQGKELQFSVTVAPYKDIQKVEFYVEDQFVGAAYSQPYSVAVSEDTLAEGDHTVVAKIYMPDTMAESPPATFTAQLAASPDTSTNPASTSPATPTTPPPTATTPASVAAPTNLTANPSDDGASVTLGWDAADRATHYQVWRDGTKIATIAGTGYTDIGLDPGQTYSYQVVATDDDGNQSPPSAIVTATTPTAAPKAKDTTQGQSATQAASTDDTVASNGDTAASV